MKKFLETFGGGGGTGGPGRPGRGGGGGGRPGGGGPGRPGGGREKTVKFAPSPNRPGFFQRVAEGARRVGRAIRARLGG